jgi:hypothetical protein
MKTAVVLRKYNKTPSKNNLPKQKTRLACLLGGAGMRFSKKNTKFTSPNAPSLGDLSII